MKKIILYSAIYIASVALLIFVVYIIAQNGEDVNKDIAVPQDWAEYKFNDGVFSIKVPPTVELRGNTDKHTQMLSNSGLPTFIDEHSVIFQQKGLSFHQDEAKGKYARIILQFYTKAPNTFPKRHESISAPTQQEVYEIINNQIGYSPTPPNVYDIEYGNEIINGNQCFIIRYTRTGVNNAPPVKSKICIFLNDRYFAKIVYSYRVVHSEIWANDFDQSLQTFRWLK